MNVLAIITEYNPFHYGHLYHLKKAKEITNSEAVICMMNGNFMQRGLPALCSKWSRTKMALKNGADLVLELPLVYGIRSAEYFAKGAVQSIEKTAVVKSLVFGSETGNIKQLETIAEILVNNPDYLQKRIKLYMKKGFSYPDSREKGLYDFLKINNYRLNEKKIKEIIEKPNNILGIEYLKALKKINSSIKTKSIIRKKSAYHDQKPGKGIIASATSIRKKLYNGDLENIKRYLPLSVYRLIKKDYHDNKLLLDKDRLSIMILSKLRQLTPENLQSFSEIKNGLENRIHESAKNSGSYLQLIENIKSKAYTQTRIQRNLLHILFDIKQKDFEIIDHNGPHYLRVLGLNNKGKKLLSMINKRTDLPVIINPSEYLNDICLESNDPLLKSLSLDVLASDLYTLLYQAADKRKSRLDFTTPLIKYE